MCIRDRLCLAWAWWRAQWKAGIALDARKHEAAAERVREAANMRHSDDSKARITELCASLAASFRFYDADGSGALDKQELCCAFRKLYEAEGISRSAKKVMQEVDEQFDLYDHDSSNSLSLADFASIWWGTA
eukprot:TRINITY_DN57270_c0_g1_i2.p3 TRINITY_DN57270_c0_g1~~TRINITY_DN57270_c0_g1_i2.p3  ORF type:complete len:132 (-),score=43.64 TRINITY_DN57270_c0_g1_i2:782-1177(-)